MKNKDKIKRLEKKIKSDGFKKKWLGDNSGYWFQKKIKLFKNSLKKTKFYALADPEFKYYYIDIETKNTKDSFLYFKTYKKLMKFVRDQS